MILIVCKDTGNACIQVRSSAMVFPLNIGKRKSCFKARVREGANMRPLNKILRHASYLRRPLISAHPNGIY